VTLVKAKLARHHSDSIPWGADFKDDLWSDPAFFPLQVGTPVAFRASKGDQHIGGHTHFRVPLDGVPQQVTCHKDLWVGTQQRVKAPLNCDNPAKLFGIVGQGVSIALWVGDLCDVYRCGQA
jgi:hypothetical protein